MLIRLSDAALLADLCAHLLRSGFTVQEAGGTMIEVAQRDVPSPMQERREIELHLRAWHATNPDAKADLLD